jgi:hypothetical protein
LKIKQLISIIEDNFIIKNDTLTNEVDDNNEKEFLKTNNMKLNKEGEYEYDESDNETETDKDN